jgi:hypothetical protein
LTCAGAGELTVGGVGPSAVVVPTAGLFPATPGGGATRSVPCRPLVLWGMSITLIDVVDVSDDNFFDTILQPSSKQAKKHTKNPNIHAAETELSFL